MKNCKEVFSFLGGGGYVDSTPKPNCEFPCVMKNCKEDFFLEGGGYVDLNPIVICLSSLNCATFHSCDNRTAIL